MADKLDLGREEEMALEEETAQDGTPVEPQEPPVQPMEMALEGPEDVAHGGSGDVALGGPGEKNSEEWLLGIAQGGLPEAALVEPGEQKPNETQNTKWVKELTCWPRCSLPSTRKTQSGKTRKALY